jgi:Flp pilus assembly protein TadB
MAQTRKRRRTKHRGNAAGMVEARGRTGRKPTSAERKASNKELARQKRLERLDRPPTWRGAINRAAIAAVIFGIAVALLGQQVGNAVMLAAFMFLLYIPMSFYTDQFIYRRRQRKKAQGGS